jgi:hypothetical protein
MAAASIMLTAIGTHDQGMLDRVITTGAVYFPDYVAAQKNQSEALSLDSFANIRNRCTVQSVSVCGGGVASVEWSCPKARLSQPSEIWSDIRVDDQGKITRVTGDGPPLVCLEPLSPPERG